MHEPLRQMNMFLSFGFCTSLCQIIRILLMFFITSTTPFLTHYKHGIGWFCWRAGLGWGELAVPTITQHPATAIIFIGSQLTIVSLGPRKWDGFMITPFSFQQSIDTVDAAWKIRSGSKWSLEYYSNLLPFVVVMSCERCQFVVMFGYCGCLLVIIYVYIHIYIFLKKICIFTLSTRKSLKLKVHFYIYPSLR